MFCVIYQFKLHPNSSEEFLAAWHGLTKLIYQYEGSLGSRLHTESENVFIAYAQWPNRKMWEESGSKLPEKATVYRQKMRAACIEINTLHQLEMHSDLLIHPTI